MGVVREPRGDGYGVAITVAAAVALRELGSSSGTVCGESSTTAALNTQLAAGLTAHEQGADLQPAT